MKKIFIMAMMLAAGACMSAQTTPKSGNTTRTLRISTQTGKTVQPKKSQAGEKTVKTQTSAKTQVVAKPFKGEWANKEGDMYLEIDLYAKSIGVEYGEPSHGSLTVSYMNSRDINDIQSSVITGNTALLNMVCRDSKVTVKLTYNPKNRTMTVSEAKLDGDSMCILDGIDPVVLYKKK